MGGDRRLHQRGNVQLLLEVGPERGNPASHPAALRGCGIHHLNPTQRERGGASWTRASSAARFPVRPRGARHGARPSLSNSLFSFPDRPLSLSDAPRVAVALVLLPRSPPSLSLHLFRTLLVSVVVFSLRLAWEPVRVEPGAASSRNSRPPAPPGDLRHGPNWWDWPTGQPVRHRLECGGNTAKEQQRRSLVVAPTAVVVDSALLHHNPTKQTFM
ncbi:hypothetical protein OPV22_010930 [Ensete ventricosum]|uniref:Uncharacterized protein n=1 Tax=Ensete ventricosum TaxID=4639 RepID=A0AAV8R8J3_ENSVE|nr:hypothetical protein OPV22_010930 [Ensete ventricosum]